MPKVAIVPAERSRLVETFSGDGRTRAYLDRETDSIHVHAHDLDAGGTLRLGPCAADTSLYVWAGAVVVAGRSLAAGSSLMAAHGATVELVAQADSARLLSFAAGSPRSATESGRAMLELLPVDRVPRYADGGVGGGLHADAGHATCPIWLHENSLAAPAAGTPADRDAGIHSHAEDEVIFVTRGQMRLGARLYGPGTAVAIAAGTMYGFTVGPEGLCFVNFRPGRPDLIRFKNGMTVDEIGYWHARVPSPAYISLPGTVEAVA